MGRPRIRPRFRVAVGGEPETARRRLERAVRAGGGGVRGGRVGDRLELSIPREERHYWSPHLSVVIDEDGGVVVAEGRFGPHPHVWTMFLAIYAVVIFAGLAGAMYGLSQWVMGQSPWALWTVPASAVLWALVYLSAFYGQGLGREQMYRLRSFVEDALATEDPAPPPDPQG